MINYSAILIPYMTLDAHSFCVGYSSISLTLTVLIPLMVTFVSGVHLQIKIRTVSEKGRHF